MAELKTLKGLYTAQEVERLFWQWQTANNQRLVYSVHFADDGRAACQFDQLKLNWFETSLSQLADCLGAWSEQQEAGNQVAGEGQP